MGRPVLKAEIKKLGEILEKIDINMSRELDELDLPETRPQTVPPPPEYQHLVNRMSFNPVLDDVIQLYLDGHINESVRKSLEIFEKTIQDMSGLNDVGKDLMMKALSENSPLIEVADVSKRSGKSFQEGYRFISAGVMLFWRNRYSHGNEDQSSYIDGLQILLTVNQLFEGLKKPS